MTTRTRTASTRRKAVTVVPQRIPADMMGVGFVAVGIRFPDPATAHRVTQVFLDSDDAQPSVTECTQTPVRRETRAACQAQAATADTVYELSAPFAHSRGAVACGDPACFGGAR